MKIMSQCSLYQYNEPVMKNISIWFVIMNISTINYQKFSKPETKIVKHTIKRNSTDPSIIKQYMNIIYWKRRIKKKRKTQTRGRLPT